MLPVGETCTRASEDGDKGIEDAGDGAAGDVTCERYKAGQVAEHGHVERATVQGMWQAGHRLGRLVMHEPNTCCPARVMP